MLHLLVEYARTHGLTIEPGFKPKTVKWGIRFTSDGRFSGVVPLGQSEEKGWKGMEFPACPDLSQPELVGGSEPRCHFLIESATVVALYHQKEPFNISGKDAADFAKAHDKHPVFLKNLIEAAAAIPELGRIADALNDEGILEQFRKCLKECKAKSTDLVTLGSEGFPGTWFVKSDTWHDWWRDFRRRLSAKTDKPESKRKKAAFAPQSDRMRCLISGDLVEPALTHPKISGLSDVGGQGSGSSLISFDKEAFTSFGLNQSRNAAISEDMATAYRAALNALINSGGRRLAGTKVVHWYAGEVPPEDDVMELLSGLEDASPEAEEANARNKARLLLDAIRSGKRPDLARCRYCALTLSGAAGRVMIRDWMEGQFDELVQNVNQWFDDLEMVGINGEIAKSPRFLWILGAVVKRENGKARYEDVPPPLEVRLWRAAVRGEPIPDAALALALDRFRCELVTNPDRPGDPVRMGLLRAYLVRKGDSNMKHRLNPEHPDPAYHCGRLLAVLARLQESALGKVGAGVIQRFYPAASTTPALVLGRLIRTAQFHADKLSSKGLAHWYHQQIAAIMSALGDSIPRTLTLEQQSVFALGFYQQYAEMSHKKDEVEESSTESGKEAVQ
jgi:CRISPR-associated protein Csd1